MLNLKKVLKSYSETGSLNEQVNLYGFVDPHTFLTKSGMWASSFKFTA